MQRKGERAVADRWFKNNAKDRIWWKDTQAAKGEWCFSFDKVQTYNMFADYPCKLTPQQKAIFDAENPFWAEFFADRACE